MQRVSFAAMVMLAAASAVATDLSVQPAALDQPRIYGYFSSTPTGTPLTADFGGGVQSFNIEAFFDTGASGILLSEQTADLLGVTRQTINSANAIFEDVGVGGNSQYNISNPYYLHLAGYQPNADVDNPSTYSSVYTQQFGPVRTQIGPINVANPDPALEGLDVIGMPAMQNKVVVMDPRPVDTFIDTMHTFVYNPGTPFNAAAQDTDPGIPITDRHVSLSYGDFARFTYTTPGATPPSLATNPFIGPNPVLGLTPGAPVDNTPGVKLRYNGLSKETSLLLDTGAAASIISNGVAGSLGVSYDPAAPSDSPRLLGVPSAEQFTLTIGGTGGTQKIAGFFLESLLMRTDEGVRTNDADPNHIRYLSAPVLVYDIAVADPVTGDELTLDGILGMNYLVASAFVIETDNFPIIGGLTRGAFDWLTFDQPAAKLGLKLKDDIPPQDELTWLGSIFDPTSDWDIATSFNWVAGLSSAAYEEGDPVNFTDTTFDPNVKIVSPVTPGGVKVNNTTDAPYRLYGSGRIQGFTGMTKSGNGRLRIETQNTYTGATDLRGGSIELAARQDIGPVRVGTAGSLFIETRQRFGGLDIEGQASLTSIGGAVVTKSLSITGNGKLDLGTNPLVIDHDGTLDANAVRLLIQRAFANGAWTGPGLTSRNANTSEYLGYAPATTLFGSFPAVIGNESIDATSLVIRLTLAGDADLNGAVNVSDLGRLAANFRGAGVWTQGDFNYDGLVNVSDLGLLAANFRGSYTAAAALLAGTPLAALWEAAIPEPSLAMALPCLLLFLRRQ